MKPRSAPYIATVAIFAAALGLCASVSRADDRTVPVVELGWQKYTGVKNSSARGSTGYSVAFRSEAEHGWLRGQVAAQFDYSAGTASLDTELKYKLYGGSFVPGYSVYIFKEGYFQPFFTASGILGWNFMQLSDAPDSVEPFTQGYAYGFELSSGVDIRSRRADGRAVRFKASYRSYSGALGGASPFSLSGFRFSIGMVF